MDSIYIRNFSIEVTRRCNMACSHCMRGNAMALDISHSYIRNILNRVRGVHNINITGGEPSLNVKAMRYLLSCLKRRGIPVDRFYIVTNGSLSSISSDFIETCCALYDYQTEKVEDTGRHMLELSDDRFHNSAEREKVITCLSGLSFFGMRGQSEHMFLFKEGRCTVGFDNPVYPIYMDGDGVVHGDVYLNAKGMVCSNGDMSYQRQESNFLCTSSRFYSYLKSTVGKY
ncbi:radical SAM protein [Phocaeicola plebeius]|uniref:radical SAM protein n=1 Tax=Phocaeicola plebeius TaxID=310297 RepID=UPI00356917B1